MSSGEVGGHCYCGVPNIDNPDVFKCDKCKKKFHSVCLKSGLPSTLKGDFLFHFKCEVCGDGEEEFERMRLQWTQVVQLALYNLQLSGAGMCGYFRWKEHICTFIDKHWVTLFGSHRKKTSLWYGTVAGVLSSGCPTTFLSGSQELGESGWWRLAEIKPPYVIKTATPGTKTVVKKKETPPPAIEAHKEGLRSRRGKTSIEAAMELKAKRATLTEAKEIRKSRKAGVIEAVSSPETFGVTVNTNSNVFTSSGISLNQIVTSQGLGVVSPVAGPSTPILQPSSSSVHSLTVAVKQETATPLNTSSALYSYLTSDDKTKQHLSRSSQNRTKRTSKSPGTKQNMEKKGQEVPSTSDFKKDSNSDSLASAKLLEDDTNYLTERDLIPQDTIPNMLLSEDLIVDDSDSDFEIDPGTFSPPPPWSPVHMQESPTVQELLSAMDSGSASAFESHSKQENETAMEDTKNGSSNQRNNVPMETDSSEEDNSVVDSESESDSKATASSSSEEEEEDSGVEQDTSRRRRREKRKATEEEKEKQRSPEVKCHMMSSYEERQLLKQLDAATKVCGEHLPVHINRLRRKLIVRQLKREHGLPLFDLDAELNRLAKTHWGTQWDTQKGGLNIPIGRIMPGDVRILDKFQSVSHTVTAHLQKHPSFLNRLVGTEDDQLQSICSPYTARILKPFIRRDYESRPPRMQLLQEIQAYPHRNDKDWKSPDPPPIDYCYVRPQHIPSVNALCREFFWPGIDLSECLQYPDFSCVVLFRKIVIGFAFMVPDVKYNEAYISFIFSHPEWRRAGLATFMVYHLIQTCMGKDLTLHVSATNPAMMLYQKFGFKPEEFIIDFYDKYYHVDSKECKHAFFLRLRR
ncbi:hypothetical protein CHS0354_001174 [Potamilus streckersoni]|uniref:N-acetyltransferase domain-containing protein n=1 Tax=Potamilus streckersoni TaxID=2493646 RepID=A0AAE0T662_9BIVA|nr:hypothetical protein CHS0354_001174 [Potamilus streckersoni]